MDHPTSIELDETLSLRARAAKVYSGAWLVGGVGIIGAMMIGYLTDHTLKRFFFAYLVSFMYFLSLCLGGLFFVLIQHVTKAAWSVNVRRIAEWFAASMPIMAILATPIVIPVLLHQTYIYPWANASARAEAPASHPTSASAVGSHQSGASEEAPEEMNGFKKVYLSPTFWALRIVIYFLIWSVIGIWYWRKSLEQDKTGDINLTVQMQSRSPLAIILFAVTTTGAAFDFLMALDASWSSTIFGVYYFAGCVVGIFASIIVSVRLLQHLGYLRESITIEHFHDLGKFLFAFTFFWGYIGFSQFMLQWYANLPEETLWYRHRGATTAIGSTTGWSYVCIALLFGHLFIPFLGLISRHVKRCPTFLCFWAVWLLVFHWIDMFWLIMPELDYKLIHFGAVDVAAFFGIGGVFFAFVLSRAAHGALRPLHDPRLQASIELQNI